MVKAVGVGEEECEEEEGWLEEEMDEGWAEDSEEEAEDYAWGGNIFILNVGTT
jgi:hypothetical protein